MREVLILLSAISIPCVAIKGCAEWQNVQAMNAEIARAHANGEKECPPPSPRDEHGNLIGPTPAQIQAERQAAQYGE